MPETRLDANGLRWLAAAAPALLVAGHSIDASPPRLAVGVLAAVAVVGLSGRRLPAMIGAGAAALIAYLLVASLPLQPARLVALTIALGAISAAQPAARRVLALACALAVGLAVALTIAVLMKAGWAEEARLLGRLASGLSAFGIVVLGLTFSENAESRAAPPHQLAILVVVACGVLVVTAARPATSPAWRAIARALPEPPISWHGDSGRTVQALEQLRVIGLRDAAAALAAVSLEQNADAKAVRQHCTGPDIPAELPEAWQEWVTIGRLACRAVHMSPLSGAALLLPLGADTGRWKGVLTRLAADLLVEADDLDGARTAFLQADALGDRFARRDLVRVLIDADRYVEALDVADPKDVLTRVWLGLPVAPERAWRAWSRSLDFDGLEPPRRVGMSDLFFKLDQPPRSLLRGPDRLGRVLSVHDRLLQRRTVWVLTSHVHTTAAYLPIPPGRQIPGELTLEIAVARGIRLRLVTDDDEDLIYTCGAHPTHVNRRVVLFPEDTCRGDWTTVRIRPADHLRGKLAELEINGEFALAHIAGRPPAE